jgi:uncharacterized membrane protein
MLREFIPTSPTKMEEYGTTKINVGKPERVVSLVGGAALTVFGTAYGIARRNVGGLGLTAIASELLYRGVTGHCPVYELLGVNTAVTGLSHQVSVPHGQGYKIEQVITVDKPRAELYQFWHDLTNLPLIMRHLESVQYIDYKQSHWIAKGPAGMKVEWDAEIINEVENEVIGWRSLEGAAVDNAGSVRFVDSPAGRGTEIHVTLKYDVPGGLIGSGVAKLFGESPELQIRDDLRRFKMKMETGEVATGERQLWEKEKA